MMERVLEHTNLQRALKRVRGNKGSPGIDGMTVDKLPEWLREHWPRVREELLAGTYQPHAVRRVMIPKPGGGERMLGIPTVLDRLIQQALLQVLQPPFDATFSEHSHGFRPNRGAHGAMREVCAIVEGGKRWVVDVDLEKFFDRVNHDVLMGKLAKRIADRRVLRLIRRYLNAGVMANGVVVERREGTPQGGPLSPLLANVLLDEVDKELEQRGHAFVRYADDLRVFVRTEVAGERVMRSLVMLFGRLHLRVNEAKSAVAPAASRPFLSFTLSIRHDAKTEPLVAPSPSDHEGSGASAHASNAWAQPRRSRPVSRRLSERLARLLPGRQDEEAVSRRWTGGSATDCGPTSSNNGNAAQPCSESCGPVGSAPPLPREWQATLKRWWRNSAMAINAAFLMHSSTGWASRASPLTSTHRTAWCGPACQVVLAEPSRLLPPSVIQVSAPGFQPGVPIVTLQRGESAPERDV